MKVLFITPYFPPEVGAAQTRIYELAVRLHKLGHQIAVLTTFPNYPSGVVPPEWRGKLFWKGVEEGITVYRVWSYAAANRGFLKRVISQLSFAFSSAVGGALLPACDALVVESPPLFDGFAGIFLSVTKRAPFLFMVSDLWPESAVQMGVLRNRRLIWAAKKMELLFYRRAAAVLALTAGIKQKIQADGIAASKVVLFRNSVDCEFFRPDIPRNGLRQELGLGEQDYLAVYAGTLGLAHNLSTVLEAAALLQQRGETQVKFLLAGDGAESSLLRAKAAAMKLRNLKIVQPLPKARMPEVLNTADCVLVPLRNLEIFQGALPTKMFEAMACAKPVVLGVPGEAAELIRESGAGCCIAPEHPQAICDAVLHLRSNVEIARRMGRRGRDYVVRQFAREKRAQQLSEVLQSVVSDTDVVLQASRNPSRQAE